MNVTILIAHAVCSLFLVGALTHQAIAAWWPRKPGQSDFVARYRGVNAAGYTDAVVVAYIVTAILGMIVYTVYRIEVRPALEDLNDIRTIGLFELKEHFLAISFSTLPAYWYFWRKRPEMRNVRGILALFLAANVSWGFVVGHLVNNVRGLV